MRTLTLTFLAVGLLAAIGFLDIADVQIAP